MSETIKIYFINQMDGGKWIDFQLATQELFIDDFWQYSWEVRVSGIFTVFDTQYLKLSAITCLCNEGNE